MTDEKRIDEDPSADSPSMCLSCGGTGDAWDDELNDWANPPFPCPACTGWGEISAETDRCGFTWTVDRELHECLFRHPAGCYHLCDCGAKSTSSPSALSVDAKQAAAGEKLEETG